MIPSKLSEALALETPVLLGAQGEARETLKASAVHLERSWLAKHDLSILEDALDAEPVMDPPVSRSEEPVMMERT